jgi:tRNA(fMet)-specific endonuclease VapC
LADYVRLVPTRFPVLPYDQRSADRHATVRAREATRGVARPFVDGQIAAVATTNGLTLVTRNLADFVGIEDLVVESWH